MLAIAFDLDYWETQMRHPKSLRQAYGDDIEKTLGRYGFFRVQQSTFHCEGDLANLISAVNALKALPWFADCVKDIPGYRVEQWSDLTPLMKGSNL